MAVYEKCEYFEAVEDTLQSTVFDHPDYEYFCNKDGKRKKIIFPEGCCGRCLARREAELNFKVEKLSWNELNKVIEDVLHIRELAIMRLYRMVKNGELTRFRDFGGWGAKTELFKEADAKDIKFIIDTVEAGYKENVYEILHSLLGAKAWEYFQGLIEDTRKQYYLDTTMFYIDLACKLNSNTKVYTQPQRYSQIGKPVVKLGNALYYVNCGKGYREGRVFKECLENGYSEWLVMTGTDINKHRAKDFRLFADNIIDLEPIKNELDDTTASYNIMIEKIAKEVLYNSTKK